MEFAAKRLTPENNMVQPTCGFDPHHKIPNYLFSLRFFIITLIVLIFDVEIAIIFPIRLNAFFISYAFFYTIFFILPIGLFYI